MQVRISDKLGLALKKLAKVQSRSASKMAELIIAAGIKAIASK